MDAARASIRPSTHSFIHSLSQATSARKPQASLPNRNELLLPCVEARSPRFLLAPFKRARGMIAVDWDERRRESANRRRDWAIGQGQGSRVRVVECGSEGSVFADRPWREPTRRMPPRGAQTPWWISSPGGSTSGVSLKRAAMMEADFTSRCVYSHEHEASPRDPRPWRTP